MKSSRLSLIGLACAMYGAGSPVHAQNGINETLTGASAKLNWIPLGGACLTAGDGSGTIPKCDGLKYYTDKKSRLIGGRTGLLPDTVGNGALRLTNGDTELFGSMTYVGAGTNGNLQRGGVLSKDGFSSTSGVQIRFTTVTYGGNGYDKATGIGKYTGQGADGISFFLADADAPATIGAVGGSLGYACSNVHEYDYEGVASGYIGIGIDEFGNFDDARNTTDTQSGTPGSRITLRAAGNTTYAALAKAHPDYYPPNLSPALKRQAVNQACSTGKIRRYDPITGSFPTEPSGIKLDYNYRFVASSGAAAIQIASQQGEKAPLRDKATPISYGVKITQEGLLDFSYSVNGGAEIPVISKQDITKISGPLPNKFRFGFSASTGSGSNIHEITCFKAEPVNKSESSAGSNTGQSGQLQVGTQLYLAFDHPANWWGELRAHDLVFDTGTKVASVRSNANWNASCNLTGGACPATGTSATAQGPSARTMLTWNPVANAPIPFQWTSLDATQKTALESSSRVDYLRGNRSQEITRTSGSFRAREGVLGDISRSGPVWVGPPQLPYAAKWADLLHAAAVAPEQGGGAQSYEQFKAAAASRQNVVYVGSNDGFLHGFRAGAYDAANKFAPGPGTPNDGAEVLAYMPSSVLKTIHSTTETLDFSSTSYAHNLYVDATPGTGDLYYNNAWHTWIVSGIGGGANPAGPINDKKSPAQGTLFALDVTDPSKFSEGNAAAIVKGEWTSATLACNVANCGRNLGSVYGTPIIRRLHDGNWAALFGNGLNSVNGSAGLFVMHVDATTGDTTFRFLDTAYGPSNDPASGNAKNGIVEVASADLDADHITDYVYAGDVFGNLWRFDLTDTDPSRWSVSAKPLFTTQTGQPISTRATVSAVPKIGKKGEPGVMVAFGTGQQWPQTQSSAAIRATGTQALYGIWDSDLGVWNAKAAPTARYAALSPAPAATFGDLQAQKVTQDIGGKRTLSSYPVCWKDSSACATEPNVKLGWTLPLPAKNEQVVYNPLAQYEKFMVNTLIPEGPQNNLTCQASSPAGYTMAPSLATGGAGATSFFADANGKFENMNGQPISGVDVGYVGSPMTVIMTDGTVKMAGQTPPGDPKVIDINPPPGESKRLTWIKRR